MRDWEFLLQKEGDRSWLPLESPTVEILEGRYRVVAQSRRENATVEIRIVHQSLDDNPSRRRLQMRSAQTNDRGLVVVMPYTHLQPGRWELRAQGDLMADMLGESWQATVELQVFAQEADWEWPQTNQPAANTAQPSELVAVAAAEALPLPIESAVARSSGERAAALQSDARMPEPEAIPATVAEAVQRFDERSVEPDRLWEAADAVNQAIAPQAEPAAPQPSFNPSPEPTDLASLSELRLLLTQTSFVARPGELLKLHGQIAASTSAIPPGLTMEVVLRDPQQSQVLAEVREPLPVQSLPLPFECEIEIPNNAQTHLLLGELTIATATGAIVARFSFTVTIALEQLLATLNGNLPEADWLQPPLQFAEPETPDLNLSLLDLVGTPKPTQFQALQPTNSPAIPPQLVQPEPTRAPKPLQLPFADRTRPRPVEAAEIQEAQRSTDPNPLPALEPEVAQSTAIEPATPEPLAIEPVDLPMELPMELMMPSDPIRSPLAPPARCEDAAFRSLNLQQRFWSRLNSLASDDELSGWLGKASPEQSGANHLPEADAEVAAQEFVVEDEYPMRSAPSAPIEPSSMVVPEEEAIPLPELELPPGELTAGAALLLRVKLPDVAPRIYVKLWLRDAQSRSLLDGPRWLVDFAPDGHGNLEARLSLKVPFGCVELQFEAIAVEMATQRESHKSIALRPVVPPDLSVMSVDLDF
ncbi:hypothetical protein [Microcoleus sp. FACHB-1515]|uniref:hypothetical protein n=2 Tax=Cyanophyceae TaxID=3028117 RepID=UPI0016896FB7|nr:hypothetical protein [Microcoleus sp. FACHB-1515]